MAKPRATADRFQITGAQAAVDIADALRDASFENPLTMRDLAQVVAGVDREDWEAMTAKRRKWYRHRARHTIDCLHFVGGLPIAEGERDGVLVYFLLKPP